MASASLARWRSVGLAHALSSASASASAAPAASQAGPRTSSIPEGPAPPPASTKQQPGPKASPQPAAQPGPKASPQPATQPGPKASPQPAAQPGPKASPQVEGPALPPDPGGARIETERPWLADGAAPDPGGESQRGGLGLTRRRDGSMMYVDPGKRFTAAVNRDGTVRFGDRWGRDQHGERMRGSGAALRSFGPSGIGGLGMAVTGPTEWLMALSGVEFDAAAKTAFLNQTRDLRIQISVAYTRQLLETRLAELGQELLGLTADASRSLAERRAILFQRWDECDERMLSGLPTTAERGELPVEAVSAIDEARLAAADKARRAIEGFIRRQLPRGSSRAYTPAELGEFNRRRVSAEPFAPYELHEARAARPSPPSSVPKDMSSGAALP
ncbi:MAG: hypothetical protein JNK56_27175 [Myxococcales bacterium]|nr:hypothetical protein [Myxococcales bacterium]